MRKVTLPTGTFISPGEKKFQVELTLEEEVWWMGHLIETKIVTIDETHVATVPNTPGEQWSLFDKTWTIVTDDDESFWGVGGKDGFLEKIRKEHIENITKLADQFGWDLDENFNPLPGAVVFSKSEMEAEGRSLMAHIMVELNIFPSVGQARKNGWDKPLELGEFTVTKKKIRFKVVE